MRRRVGWITLWPVVLLLAGCPQAPDASPGRGDQEEERAPHGGIKFAQKEHKYHAELVLDKEKKQATVYMLDRRLRKTVPIEPATIQLGIRNGTPLVIELTAERQDDDPKERSSRFVATHDKFGDELDPEKIDIIAKVDGKQYTFTLDKH